MVVTQVLAYWRRLVSWVQLQWQALLASLPGHHQTRAEAAASWLQDAWDSFQHLAGRVRVRIRHRAMPGALGHIRTFLKGLLQGQAGCGGLARDTCFLYWGAEHARRANTSGSERTSIISPGRSWESDEARGWLQGGKPAP